METRTCSPKTPRSDDPSPSNPFLSQDDLDGFPPVPSLIDDSLPGAPSSVSPMLDDSSDLLALLGNFGEGERADGIYLPELLDFDADDSKKPQNCQEEKEDHSRWLSSDYNSNQLNGSRENECSAWPPWSSLNSSVPHKEPFGFVNDPTNDPTGLGAGLANLGNTCFINAVLQCFTHTVPFVNGLRSLNHHNKLCDSYISSFCLLCALHDHIELTLNSSGGVVSPFKIFDNLKYISPCFQRYLQEDAHEFLQCLLNRLEVCCSDLMLKDDCLSSPDVCLVNKVFGGRLVSRLRCCNCRYISHSYEPFNDLSLEIEDSDTLPSALESFTKVENIDDLVAQFWCENCKDKVSVEKQLMLDQAPSVAIFHLKRFKTDGINVEKIDKHVVFPLELDLQPYTSVNQTSSEEVKYHLYAVVKHSGFKPTSGHYVCYIRSSPDTWHNLNDSIVSSVEEEEVLSQEAYILFYAREDIPWFSTAIEVQKSSQDVGISDPSPKSILDYLICAADLPVENNTDCYVNESKDVADRTSNQFSCETQPKLELDEASIATQEISDFHVPKSVGFRDDSPINESTVSNLAESKTNGNQGIDKATSDGAFPWKCPDKRPRDSSVSDPRFQWRGKQQAITPSAVHKTLRHRRMEAIRHAKRMPSDRRAKFMSLLTASEVASTMKKRGW